MGCIPFSKMSSERSKAGPRLLDSPPRMGDTGMAAERGPWAKLRIPKSFATLLLSFALI